MKSRYLKLVSFDNLQIKLYVPKIALSLAEIGDLDFVFLLKIAKKIEEMINENKLLKNRVMNGYLNTYFLPSWMCDSLNTFSSYTPEIMKNKLRKTINIINSKLLNILFNNNNFMKKTCVIYNFVLIKIFNIN